MTLARTLSFGAITLALALSLAAIPLAHSALRRRIAEGECHVTHVTMQEAQRPVSATSHTSR